tara:strand:+ start:1038 stop:1514 length:477 start_codon:yes stop_codon:yes gene_type:complete
MRNRNKKIRDLEQLLERPKNKRKINFGFDKAKIEYDYRTLTDSEEVDQSGNYLTISGSQVAIEGDIFINGSIQGASPLVIKGAVTMGGTLTPSGSIVPSDDVAHDLGSTELRWKNIYTGDLHLKNDRGDWTIVEEEDHLTIINNKKGKRYKFVLEEIL